MILKKEENFCSKEIWKKKFETKYYFTHENYNSDVRNNFFSETLYLINKNFNKFYFISAGTLLGFIRENDFIKWDDNIDLSFFLEKYSLDDLKNLQLRLIEKDYVARIFEKKNYLKISIYKYGYRIDLTSILKVKKFYISHLYKFPSDCLNQFETVLFKNTYVKIPTNHNRYLTFLYGNWKTPQKENYATIKSTRIEHYWYIFSNIKHQLLNFFFKNNSNM